MRATKDINPDIFWVCDNAFAISSFNQLDSLYQALKGAASSFAITTSLEVNTYAAPSYAIVMYYSWNSIDYKKAGQYLDYFQTFSLSGPPSAWAGELIIGKGEQQGQVTFDLRGAWYGGGDLANATAAIQPFLNMMPKPGSVAHYGDGTYIGSVIALAGDSPLNTSTKTERKNTFYTKSLMTPESDPMSLEASTAFMEYLANKGFSSDTVCDIHCYSPPYQV